MLGTCGNSLSKDCICWESRGACFGNAHMTVASYDYVAAEDELGQACTKIGGRTLGSSSRKSNSF